MERWTVGPAVPRVWTQTGCTSTVQCCENGTHSSPVDHTAHNISLGQGSDRPLSHEQPAPGFFKERALLIIETPRPWWFRVIEQNFKALLENSKTTFVAWFVRVVSNREVEG